MSRKCFFVLVLLIVGSTSIVDATSKLLFGPNEVNPDNNVRFLTEVGCGIPNVPGHNRIVGGGPAKNGAWPWMVLIGYRNNSIPNYTCGGSLITSLITLTAAHCFHRPKNILRLGEYDTETEMDGKHIDIDIDRVVKHELHDPVRQVNDIALVRMAHAVEFTDRIRPICLPFNEHTQSIYLVGSSPFVAGWGHLKENTRRSTILQEVQIPVIGNDECKRKYQKSEFLREDVHIRFDPRYVFCAGFTEGGRDACQGDSGGPLMLPVPEPRGFAFYQMGIVSHGIGCAQADFPGVYTNVRFYINWIFGKLQTLHDF